MSSAFSARQRRPPVRGVKGLPPSYKLLAHAGLRYFLRAATMQLTRFSFFLRLSQSLIAAASSRSSYCLRAVATHAARFLRFVSMSHAFSALANS